MRGGGGVGGQVGGTSPAPLELALKLGDVDAEFCLLWFLCPTTPRPPASPHSHTPHTPPETDTLIFVLSETKMENTVAQ